MPNPPANVNIHRRKSYRIHIHNATNTVLNVICAIGVSPHFRVFARNTLNPVKQIMTEPDPARVPELISKWVRTKKIEAQYVQVAAAVTFTSVISCLSWTDLQGRHWTGPALWYGSIMLAITAVVLGATQTMVLHNVDPAEWQWIREKLTVKRGNGELRPNRAMLFVWQCPMMSLSYSIAFFIGGLMSYVYSPVAMKRRWDSDAKGSCPFSQQMEEMANFCGRLRLYFLL